MNTLRIVDPKPRPGTLADLMWMSRRVYPATFARTDDVNRADELLNEYVETGHAPRAANLRDDVRNRSIWLWTACWAHAFYPAVELDVAATTDLLRGPDVFASKLAQTEAPWMAYVIVLPKEQVSMHTGTTRMPVDAVMVFHSRESTWIATQTSGTRAGWMSIMMPDGEGFSHERGQDSNDDRHVLRWLWRIVGGVEDALRDGRRVGSPIDVPGEDPMRVKRPRTYRVLGPAR